MSKKPDKNATQIEVVGGKALKISGDQLARMLEKNDCRTKAIRVLSEALEAKKQFWSQPGRCFVEEIDHAIRIKAAEILLSYTDGQAVKRQEIVVATFESVDEMHNRVRQSPALTASLRSVVDGILKAKPEKK